MFKKIIKSVIQEELREMNIEKLCKESIKEVIQKTVMEEAGKIKIEDEINRRLNISLGNIDEKIKGRILMNMKYAIINLFSNCRTFKELEDMKEFELKEMVFQEEKKKKPKPKKK